MEQRPESACPPLDRERGGDQAHNTESECLRSACNDFQIMKPSQNLGGVIDGIGPRLAAYSTTTKKTPPPTTREKTASGQQTL
jgi:hypothetical protein